MIIIDTSVAFKWFDESEINRHLAVTQLTHHLKKQTEICVPDLFFYEITNAWATKSSLTIIDIEANILRLQKYSLNVSRATLPQILKASDLAKKYHVSVYDAVYAMLAIENHCELITADTRFVKQLNLPFIKLLK